MPNISNGSAIQGPIASAKASLDTASQAVVDDRLEDALKALAEASKTIAAGITNAAANVNV